MFKESYCDVYVFMYIVAQKQLVYIAIALFRLSQTLTLPHLRLRRQPGSNPSLRYPL